MCHIDKVSYLVGGSNMNLKIEKKHKSTFKKSKIVNDIGTFLILEIYQLQRIAVFSVL